MNLKEMFLGGWATALIVLVAVCSLGNEPFGVLPFLGVLAVVMIFTCGVRAMMLCSASDKKSIDWKAYRDYVIGAGVSVVVPALLFAIAA
jgi:hypothetical protein